MKREAGSEAPFIGNYGNGVDDSMQVEAASKVASNQASRVRVNRKALAVRGVRRSASGGVSDDSMQNIETTSSNVETQASSSVPAGSMTNSGSDSEKYDGGKSSDSMEIIPDPAVSAATVQREATETAIENPEQASTAKTNVKGEAGDEARMVGTEDNETTEGKVSPETPVATTNQQEGSSPTSVTSSFHQVAIKQEAVEEFTREKDNSMEPVSIKQEMED